MRSSAASNSYLTPQNVPKEANAILLKLNVWEEMSRCEERLREFFSLALLIFIVRGERRKNILQHIFWG